MINVLAFTFTLLQLAIITVAYYMPWEEVFTLFVAHFSPIMVFFGLMATAIEFTGEFSYWLGVGLVYCFIKYFIISRAVAYDGITFWDAGALFMEVVYLAGSTFYIVYYSYL